MRLRCLIFVFCFLQLIAKAQYAPQATLPGSTAISASSSLFVGWAAQCTIQRGYLDIASPSAGVTSLGDSSNAIGPADGSIVSLGDSGVAVLTFTHPIYNGTGPDFAVFENGFPNPANPAQAFLELAFVEVSSDGINYFRFPANSNTETTTQVPASGVYMDASLINNLAGKYIAMYGTPFDLQELSGTAGLDVNNITHVRIVDVVGSLGAHASHDIAGHVINDPYPTNFNGGGFDLDAVGAINQYGTAVHNLANNITINVFPNPAADKIFISVNGITPAGLTLAMTTPTGNILQETQLSLSITTLPVAQYPTGIYYIIFSDSNGNKWTEKFVKY